MTQWEYMKLDAASTDVTRLNKYGGDGWQLVAVTSGIVYMARPTEGDDE